MQQLYKRRVFGQVCKIMHLWPLVKWRIFFFFANVSLQILNKYCIDCGSLAYLQGLASLGRAENTDLLVDRGQPLTLMELLPKLSVSRFSALQQKQLFEMIYLCILSPERCWGRLDDTPSAQECETQLWSDLDVWYEGSQLPQVPSAGSFPRRERWMLAVGYKALGWMWSVTIPV